MAVPHRNRADQGRIPRRRRGPLRVLDLTRLEAASRRLSYFEPGYAELLGYAGFVRGFHEEVKRAVIPGRETLDYLPTQIVAEYLWARADPPFNGLIVGSSRITETRNNIALFPHAAVVEGAETDPERSIHFTYTRVDEDGEDPEERVAFDPLPEPAAPLAQAAYATSDEDWFASLLPDTEFAQPPQHALRPTEDGVSRHRVRAIAYETKPAVPISFSDWEDPGF